jgi:alkaline phosphatase D
MQRVYCPGTAYFYRFSSLGVNSETGQTKTLPVGQVASFRMGVASCSNYPQGFFNAYRHMADTDLDVVLHLGDYIYEYPEAGYANDYARNVLKRNVVPKHEVLALEDYRMRYGLYRTDPDLQAVHQRHPFICVWDDHELANNTWQDGAENHNDGEGDFYQRMRAARQAYDEWMPIRTHASGDQGPIYRRFAVGNLADLIMLDTRLEGRDRGFEYAKDMVYLPQTNADEPRKPDVAAFRAKLQDPTRTLLGAKQEAWLSDSVARSTSRGATWQVLGQQILMGNVGIPKLSQSALADSGMSEQRKKYTAFMQALGAQGLPLNLDAWDGYPACRDRIAKMLAEAKANTVALAGDTHNAWAFDLNDSEQRSIGVEVGTPGISSPGMENYLPVPGEGASPSAERCESGLGRCGYVSPRLVRDNVDTSGHAQSMALCLDSARQALRCAKLPRVGLPRWRAQIQLAPIHSPDLKQSQGRGLRIEIRALRPTQLGPFGPRIQRRPV